MIYRYYAPTSSLKIAMKDAIQNDQFYPKALQIKQFLSTINLCNSIKFKCQGIETIKCCFFKNSQNMIYRYYASK